MLTSLPVAHLFSSSLSPQEFLNAVSDAFCEQGFSKEREVETGTWAANVFSLGNSTHFAMRDTLTEMFPILMIAPHSGKSREFRRVVLSVREITMRGECVSEMYAAQMNSTGDAIFKQILTNLQNRIPLLWEPEFLRPSRDLPPQDCPSNMGYFRRHIRNR